MSQTQRDFAYKCIEWGQEHFPEFHYEIDGIKIDLGHTLAALAWMESSLGADNEHDERSYGNFGIRTITAEKVVRANARNVFSNNLSSKYPLQRDFEFAATTAILIYLDNIRYIIQWHRNRGLTITDREAWRLAAKVWPGGTNWQNREEYGRVFRQRVKFLRGLR